MSEVIVIVWRASIGFFTLLILTRFLGKQQISQLSFFDYVLGITIGSMASSLTTDLTAKPLTYFVGLVTWISFVLLLQIITLKWRKASKYIDGEPTIVVMNGQIMEKTMKLMRYRVSDLLEQLRGKNIFDLKQVEFAVLETNGTLSVQKKSQYETITPKDLKLATEYSGISIELIYDGIIVDQNLKQVNLDRRWLYSELKKFGVTDTSEVLLATLDTKGNLYVDKYQDHVKVTDPSDYYGPN